jgi:hypothetical protein
MKTPEQRDREIDDLWEFVWLRFGSSSGASLITLFASNEGAEAFVTSTTFVSILDINPNPFTSVAGQKFYAAAYMTTLVGGSGQIDLFDNTAGSSLLASPLLVSNTTPAVIRSGSLLTPLIIGHSYSIRVLAPGGGGGQETKIQTAFIL